MLTNELYEIGNEEKNEKVKKWKRKSRKRSEKKEHKANKYKKEKWIVFFFFISNMFKYIYTKKNFYSYFLFLFAFANLNGKFSKKFQVSY